MKRNQSSENKRVLITGGAGFIGSRLCLRLVAEGYSVRVLDTLSPQIHGKQGSRSPLYLAIRPHVEFLRGSILNGEMLRRALDDVDAVVHLAAETGTGQSMYEIERYVDVNVRGAAMLFDAISKTGGRVKRLVLASSRAVYGEGKYRCPKHGPVFPGSRSPERMLNKQFGLYCPICDVNIEPVPTDEDSPKSPVSIYGYTKLFQEQLLETWCATSGTDFSILRYQNVFGPGQSLKNPYTGILSIFSTRMRNGEGINIFEDGLESRDFVYIDDVVEATFRALKQPAGASHTVNVGTGVPISVTEVAAELSRFLELESKIEVSGNFRVGDIRHNFADTEKAMRVLNFQARTSFREGLKLFCEWVKEQPVEKDTYEKSISELTRKGLFK